MYLRALRSIAFYPVFISVAFLLLAVVIRYIEEIKFVRTIQEELPYLFIQDNETARTLLSVLIGGILSLTVFSFTMVMLVLNQASANFSPRLLPGLVSNKKHQVILGLYIGTLLYSILVLISLGAYGTDSESMGLSTTLAAVFGVVCVAVFVYFIHTISSAIQIQNIIERIYGNAVTALENLDDHKKNSRIALKTNDSVDWTEIMSVKSGYYQHFDTGLLSENLYQVAHQIEILPYVGQHIWEGSPIIKSAKNLSEKEMTDLLYCIEMSPTRQVDNYATGGMVQLMEIAVKALSPGINDPGTAIGVITQLGKLLVRCLERPRLFSELIKDGPMILIENNIPTTDLMRLVFQPIRNYAKQDSAVLYELILVLKYAYGQNSGSKMAKAALQNELNSLKYDITQNISNPHDKSVLLRILEY